MLNRQKEMLKFSAWQVVILRNDDSFTADYKKDLSDYVVQTFIYFLSFKISPSWCTPNDTEYLQSLQAPTSTLLWLTVI